MKILLRPHHLLCLKGYKGLNYNKQQVRNWSAISEILNKNSDVDVVIVNGKDDLCKNCPAKSPKHEYVCKESAVNALDKKVQLMLGLVIGQVYNFKNLMRAIENYMDCNKHLLLCKTCAWWKKGLCIDSFIKNN